MNRLLFGSGVVSGLQVIAVDDKSISVESGVALDQLGREIVVPSPVTLKLSNIDGFTHNEYAKNVYLCLAYDEKGKEPVHAVAGTAGREEEVTEYNRILESYRLFIQEQPPAPNTLEYDHLIEDTQVLYDDGLVRVLQSVPRYVEPDRLFYLRLTVEKTLQSPHVEFEYVPEWTDVEPVEELAEGKVKFTEPTDGGKTSYTRLVPLRALPLPEGETKRLGAVAAKSGTMKLVIGDRIIRDLPHRRQTVEVSEEPAAERILNAYYARTLDRALDAPTEPCVYLAKIHLLQMGAAYVIDSVESIPFRDRVINPSLFYKLVTSQLIGPAQPEVHEAAAVPQEEANVAPFPDIKEEFAALNQQEEEPEPQPNVCTGIAEISIVPEKKKKWYQRRQKTFYSEEIEHGLGAGTVLMTAGLSDEQETGELPVPDMFNRSNQVFYGSQRVFAKSPFAPDYPEISIGFVQYPKKGTFRIGVLVHKKTERTKIRVRWWAIRADVDRVAESRPFEELDQSLQEAAPTKA
jgi:hypothetical protein